MPEGGGEGPEGEGEGAEGGGGTGRRRGRGEKLEEGEKPNEGGEEKERTRRKEGQTGMRKAERRGRCREGLWAGPTSVHHSQLGDFKTWDWSGNEASPYVGQSSELIVKIFTIWFRT